jgi:transposase InsO family protein
MPNEEKMTINERRKYLRLVKKRYLKANRLERGGLLDEMEAVTGSHRKSLIRLMNGSLERNPRRKQRGRTYGPEADDALRVIAESFDYLCAERLTPNLVWMANHLAAHDEMEVSPPLLEKLGRISVSTVGRILARIRQDQPRLPRKGPQRAPKVTRDIPMKRISWNEQQPGHFEVDLVHHCGSSASGEYVHTLQMIDVATGWSERVAVLGRSYLVMEDAFRRILARLPFPMLEIHSDNGSEFFNHHLLRFWKDIVQGVQLSRSRPYQKNDNRFVEQKNATLVRAYLGYDRLDSVTQTLAINQLYDKMWLYYNFFQPVMRLTEKTLVSADGQPSRIKRRFDQARTPFDRLCETNVISEEQKGQLRTLREQVNPRQLRQEIYDLIDHISRLPDAVPEKTEDVYKTLSTPIQSQKGEGIPVTFSFERTISVR